MRARVQRRKKIDRHMAWMISHHPDHDSLPCYLRDYQRRANKIIAKIRQAER